MLIKTLIEDKKISPNLKNEHGLSYYIETAGHKILFDTGASDTFISNAEKMNVNLDKIDYAIISHGHYDHGGGLNAFLSINSTAPVYINKLAFATHCSKAKDGSIRDIGIKIPCTDILEKRIVITEENYQISESLELFSDVHGKELFSSCNNSLIIESCGTYSADNFNHEQNLIIEECGKYVLIAGCAHKGIVNILKAFKEKKGKYPDFVIGGFHLYNFGKKTSEDPDNIRKIGEFLLTTGSMFYTGHCTGIEAYEQLKEILKNKIQYLATGSVVEI